MLMGRGRGLVVALVGCAAGLTTETTPSFAASKASPTSLTGQVILSGVPGCPQVFANYIGGLSSESEVIEHRVISKTGTETIQKLPGQLRLTGVTLSRPKTDNCFIDWRGNVINGQPFKSQLKIEFTTATLQPLVEFDLAGAWPSKYAVSGTASVVFPGGKGGPQTVGIETITLVSDDMRRIR